MKHAASIAKAVGLQLATMTAAAVVLLTLAEAANYGSMWLQARRQS